MFEATNRRPPDEHPAVRARRAHLIGLQRKGGKLSAAVRRETYKLAWDERFHDDRPNIGTVALTISDSTRTRPARRAQQQSQRREARRAYRAMVRKAA